MKKIVSSLILLSVILSQFQVLTLYAQEASELEQQKTEGVETLELVDSIIDTTVEKLDNKIDDAEKQEQLQEKHEEIEEYLEEVEQDILEENNIEDIEERVEQAKKVVVLKVVSGVTDYEDVEDSISSEVAETPSEKQEALDVIQDSLETASGDYSIIVRTGYTLERTRELFETFDSDTRIESLYQAGGENYFEVFLKEDSIFRQEMLEDIESGILPENFLGIKIVLPEVFGLHSSSQPSPEGEGVILQGEDLTQTWGVSQYQTYEYFDDIQIDSQEPIRVGIIDTGIDYNHPDLSANVNKNLGWDFVNDDNNPWDDQGHGTHVAGTIAANLNGEGIIGVNPYVELVPLKICNESGFCPTYAIIRALEYARDEGIDIVNMSLGGYGNPATHAICDGIDSLTSGGGLVIAAAGNSNTDTSSFIPGGCLGAISVAAVDQSGNRASFSNYGSRVDAAAPGVGIYSTYPSDKGSYTELSGTSMAAPHITGLVSILRANNESLGLEDIKNIFGSHISPVQSDASHKTIAGAVDALGLLSSLYGEEEIVETQQPPILNPSPQEEEGAATSSLPVGENGEGEEAEEQSEEAPQEILPYSPIIDFGDIEEILAINSEHSSFKIVDIQEQQEEIKQYMPEEVEKVFSENGERNYDPVEINSDEIFLPAIKTQGEINAADIPENELLESQNIEINSVQTLLLGGAQEVLETNSTGSGELQVLEVELEEFPEEDELLEINSTGTGGLDIASDNPHAGEESFLTVASANSLVGEYLFEGNSSDTSGEGNNLSNVNVSYQTLTNGQVGRFNGSNSRLEKNINLGITSAPYSVSGWVKMDSNSNGFRSMFQLGDKDTDGKYFRVIFHNGKPQVNARNSSASPQTMSLQGEQRLDANTWYHIVAVMASPSDIRLYVDTVASTQTISAPGRQAINIDRFSIGRAGDSTPGLYFDGDIGLMKVYNKALTDLEIEDLYKEGQHKILGMPLSEINPTSINLSELTSTQAMIDHDNETSVDFSVIGSYSGADINSVVYSYSMDDTLYYDLEPEENIEINTVQDEPVVQLPVVEDSNFSLDELMMSLGETPESFEYQDNGERSTYINENQDLEFSVQSANTVFQDDMSDGVLDNFYAENNNNRSSEQNGYIQANQVVTDQASQLTTEWFELSEAGGTIEYDFYSHPAGDYFSGGVFLYAEVDGQEVPFYLMQHMYTKYYNGGNQPLKNKIEIRTRDTSSATFMLTTPMDGIHNDWVNHKLEFDAHQNKVFHTINGTTYEIPMDFSFWKGKRLKLSLRPSGWYTGHYVRLDNIHIEKNEAGSQENTQEEETSEAPSESVLNRGFHLDLSAEDEGPLQIFVKATENGVDSNTLSLELLKDTNPLNTPGNFAVEFIDNQTTRYSWEDTSSNPNNEQKYVIRDESGALIVDNISADSIEYLEMNLTRETDFSRKVCAVGPQGEECSNILEFTTPNQADYSQYSIFETRTRGITFGSMNLIISDPSIISLDDRGGGYHIVRGLTPGVAYVYEYGSYGDLNEIYKITIEATPEVTEYDFDLIIGQDGLITLPENISNYNFSISNDTIFDNHKGRSRFYIDNDTTFRFSVYSAGESTIYLKDDSNFPIYIVHVSSKIREKDFTIIQGESRDPGLNSADNHYSDNYDIAYVHNGDEVYANSIGETDIHSHDDGIHEQTTHVTVIPIPTPEIIDCTIYPGERCRLEKSHGGVTYTTSRDEAFEIEYGRSTIRVKGIASGTATIYVKSKYGDHITHIMNVEVIPAPPRVYTCEVPQGLECITKWYEQPDRYTITSTDTSTVNVQIENFTEYVGGQNRVTERTKIEGLAQGTADVYIYDLGDHIVTVHMTVTPPVPNFSISDHSITIDQGETARIDITSGGGNYTEESYDSTIVYADADTDLNNLTGDIDITGREPGTTEVVFKDYYYQTQSVQVTVLDTILELVQEEITVSGSNYEYIVAREAHTGIESVVASNSNVLANVIILEDGERVVRVIGVYGGQTTLTVYDYEGNTDTVEVTVTGGIGNGSNEEEVAFEFITEEGRDNFLYKILSSGIETNEFNINPSEELTVTQENAIDRITQQYIYEHGEIKALEAKGILETVTGYYGIHRIILDYAAEKIGYNLDTPLSIENLEVTPIVDEGYLGGIYFETSKFIQGVGYDIFYARDMNSKEKYRVTIEDGIHTFHAAILLPDCLTGCNFYIRPYVLDFQGESKTGSFQLIQYAGGDEIFVDNTDLLALDFSNVENSINSDNVTVARIPIGPLLSKISTTIGLAGILGCVSDTCGIDLITGRLFEKSVGAISLIYKRVLSLSSKTKVDNLSDEIGEGAQELAGDIATLRRNDFPIQFIYTQRSTVPDLLENTQLRNLMQNTLNSGKKIDERVYYNLSDNDNLLFDASVITSRLGLSKVRYGVSEIDTLITKFDDTTELMYVLKQNDELVFALRSTTPSSYFPHPVLSHGETVKMAGTIKRGGDGIFEIDNASGHFQPKDDSLLIEKIVDDLNLQTSHNFGVGTLITE